VSGRGLDNTLLLEQASFGSQPPWYCRLRPGDAAKIAATARHPPPRSSHKRTRGYFQEQYIAAVRRSAAALLPAPGPASAQIIWRLEIDPCSRTARLMRPHIDHKLPVAPDGRALSSAQRAACRSEDCHGKCQRPLGSCVGRPLGELPENSGSVPRL